MGTSAAPRYRVVGEAQERSYRGASDRAEQLAWEGTASAVEWFDPVREEWVEVKCFTPTAAGQKLDVRERVQQLSKTGRVQRWTWVNWTKLTASVWAQIEFERAHPEALTIDETTGRYEGIAPSDLRVLFAANQACEWTATAARLRGDDELVGSLPVEEVLDHCLTVTTALTRTLVERNPPAAEESEESVEERLPQTTEEILRYCFGV